MPTEEEEGGDRRTRTAPRSMAEVPTQRSRRVCIGKLHIVSGTEDEARVARAVRSSYGQFRLCYESALHRWAAVRRQLQFH